MTPAGSPMPSRILRTACASRRRPRRVAGRSLSANAAPCPAAARVIASTMICCSRVAGARQRLDQQIERLLRRARGENFDGLVAHGVLGLGGETAPALDRVVIELAGGEFVEKRHPLVRRAGGSELPEQRLNLPRDRRLGEHAPRRFLQLARTPSSPSPAA